VVQTPGSAVNDCSGAPPGSQKESLLSGKEVVWFPLFTVSSLSMVLLNKYCAHRVGRSPYTLLLCQNAATVLLNLFGVHAGVLSVRPFSTSQCKRFLVPTLLFVGMLASSIYGLPYVSVATTVVFRSLSTCLVACGDCLLFSKRFTRDEVVALALVVVGAQIYSYNDMSFDAAGYSWMLANMLFFVSSQLYEKWAIVSVDQTAVGISCIQNLLSLPVLVAFGGYTGERPLTFFQGTDAWTRAAVVATGFGGCSLSVCYISLSKFASATSISLAGNLNKLLSIVLRAALFHSPLYPLQVCGLAISMVATVSFAHRGRMPSWLGGDAKS